jgi:hypothetical protein
MKKPCSHHYKIEAPNGPITQGVCGCSCAPESSCNARQRRNSPKRGCGAIRHFESTNESAGWNEGFSRNNDLVYSSRPRTPQVMD